MCGVVLRTRSGGGNIVAGVDAGEKVDGEAKVRGKRPCSGSNVGDEVPPWDESHERKVGRADRVMEESALKWSEAEEGVIAAFGIPRGPAG